MTNTQFQKWCRARMPPHTINLIGYTKNGAGQWFVQHDTLWVCIWDTFCLDTYNGPRVFIGEARDGGRLLKRYWSTDIKTVAKVLNIAVAQAYPGNEQFQAAARSQAAGWC